VGWISLGLAIGAEVVATSALKASKGMTKPWPALVVVVGYALSFWLLSRALRHVQLSVAYAVWSAVGTAAIAAVGIVYYDEPLTALKLLGLAAVIGGVVLLTVRTG
jgi:small multidrug resistance pump